MSRLSFATVLFMPIEIFRIIRTINSAECRGQIFACGMTLIVRKGIVKIIKSDAYCSPLHPYTCSEYESYRNTTLPFTSAHQLFNFHQWPDTFVVYHLQALASNWIYVNAWDSRNLYTRIFLLTLYYTLYNVYGAEWFANISTRLYSLVPGRLFFPFHIHRSPLRTRAFLILPRRRSRFLLPSLLPVDFQSTDRRATTTRWRRRRNVSNIDSSRSECWSNRCKLFPRTQRHIPHTLVVKCDFVAFLYRIFGRHDVNKRMLLRIYFAFRK